jgi:hypothetical protein
LGAWRGGICRSKGGWWRWGVREKGISSGGLGRGEDVGLEERKVVS